MKKAYRIKVKWFDVTAVTFAENAGKARYAAMLSANDAGYDIKITEFKVNRAPEYDFFVESHARTARCWGEEYFQDMLTE